MEYSWLNIISLGLGIVAWTLPIIVFFHPQSRAVPFLVGGSLIACCISLYGQLLYNAYLVQINDWAALLDTVDAVNFVAGVLLIVTVVLNIASLVFVNRVKKKE